MIAPPIRVPLNSFLGRLRLFWVAPLPVGIVQSRKAREPCSRANSNSSSKRPDRHFWILGCFEQQPHKPSVYVHLAPIDSATNHRNATSPKKLNNPVFNFWMTAQSCLVHCPPGAGCSDLRSNFAKETRESEPCRTGRISCRMDQSPPW